MRNSSTRLRTVSAALLGIAYVAVVIAVVSVALTQERIEPAGQIEVSAWPGSPGVTEIDTGDLFDSNISGLDMRSGTEHGSVLWVVNNNPGALHRLTIAGESLDTRGDAWEGGITLTYQGGVGNPDAEGLVIVGDDAAGSAFVVAERDNLNAEESSLKVLQYELPRGDAAPPSSLSAINEWDLTNAFGHVTPPNDGFEGIAFIPDHDLVEAGLLDESTGELYDPLAYGEHSGGLFFLGLQRNGMVYAYVLSADGDAHRVATIESGLPVVSELEYEELPGRLWVACDDTCDGELAVLELRPLSGHQESAQSFRVTARYARPAAMPNIDNEGLAIAPDSQCMDGLKRVYWADDAATGGYTLRAGEMQCE